MGKARTGRGDDDVCSCNSNAYLLLYRIIGVPYSLLGLEDICEPKHPLPRSEPSVYKTSNDCSLYAMIHLMSQNQEDIPTVTASMTMTIPQNRCVVSGSPYPDTILWNFVQVADHHVLPYRPTPNSPLSALENIDCHIHSTLFRNPHSSLIMSTVFLERLWVFDSEREG